MEEKLIACLKDALELDGQSISMSDKFRDLMNWDSLAQLTLITGLDETFGVEIESDDFKKLITVRDLCDEVSKRMA
jgi:acyl carrier protein